MYHVLDLSRAKYLKLHDDESEGSDNHSEFDVLLRNWAITDMI